MNAQDYYENQHVNDIIDFLAISDTLQLIICERLYSIKVHVEWWTLLLAENLIIMMKFFPLNIKKNVVLPARRSLSRFDKKKTMNIMY